MTRDTIGSKDPDALKIPARRAEDYLTRDGSSPFPAEPRHKRHTYGAMDNIILDVRMGDHLMDDEFPTSKAMPLRVKARGARTIARVVIVKDAQITYSAEPKRQDVEFQFVDKNDVSGRHYYYVRVEQDDEMLAWSSPFFVNYK